MSEIIQRKEVSRFTEIAELAALLKNAGDFIPDAFKNNPGAIAAAILTGEELGIAPMASLRSLYVVQGKVGMSYDLIVGQLRRHQYGIEWLHSDDNKATIRITHKNGAAFEMSYSMDDAKSSQLTGRDTWKKRPSIMLRARCVATAARSFAGDIFLGMYHEDELQDIENKIIEVEVEPNQSGEKKLLTVLKEKKIKDVIDVPEEIKAVQKIIDAPVKIITGKAFIDFHSMIDNASTQQELAAIGGKINASKTVSDDEKKELRASYLLKSNKIGVSK